MESEYFLEYNYNSKIQINHALIIINLRNKQNIYDTEEIIKSFSFINVIDIKFLR